MKKILLLLFLTVIQFPSFAKEVLYLKNGSIIKGEIIDFVPNESIKITIENGSTFSFKEEDIEKIEHEDSVNLERTEDNAVPRRPDRRRKAKKAPKPSHIKKGYRGFIDFETMLGYMYGISITTTHGYQFNKELFLGVGTGYRLADDNDAPHKTVPVFASFRFDIADHQVSPFLSMRGGMTFPTINHGFSGFYGSFDFGCRVRHFSISTGLETARGDDFEYDCYRTYSYSYQSIQFVLRLGANF